MSSQKVSLATSSDFTLLADLYEKIAATATNKAFFNWNEEKASDEIKVASTYIIKDEAGLSIKAFVTFRVYEDRIEISAVGTDPAFIKQGYAQEVLNALKANAAQRKLAIWLEVHENNQTAINLYLKNGFSVLNTRKRYYPDGGGALVMQLPSA